MDDLLKAGGPAFPSSSELGEGITSSFMGMTLRDYFAGQAMISLTSSELWVTGLDKAATQRTISYKQALAEQCYVMADEMLKARSST